LLLSLDKIEKESIDLLKTDNTINDKSIKINDSINDTLNDDKMNSILSFLNEASSVTNNANNFVPKPFKDYSIDLNEFYNNLPVNNKKSSNQQTTTIEANTPRPKFNNNTSIQQNKNENESLSVNKKNNKPINNKPIPNNISAAPKQSILKTVRLLLDVY
jgi:hypothetical protein